MPDPWIERWEVLDAIGEGGQGLTKRTRSRRDGSIAVLKILRKQQDPDRRARMHREAEALRTLSHAGIPKLLDGNTSEFAAATKLFIVTELIEGPTLEKMLDERGPLSPEDAIALTTRLVDVVAYCHERSFAHRDIKPDNIILRGNNVNDPVLIDFGLSFNIEDLTALATGSEQQIGNRFLALPELTTPGGEKRDPRADLASCCGILYFALSGFQPMTLRDAENKAPHERREFSRIVDQLPERTKTLMNLLFGRGFMYPRDQRYQDAAELQADLNALLATPNYPEGAERVRSAIDRAQLRNRGATISRTNREEALGDVLRMFIGPIRTAVAEQVASRVNVGIPIQNVPVDPENWSGIAGRVYGRSKANIFHYWCQAPGTRGFNVYFQLQPSEYEAEGTVITRLFTESGQAVREAHYLLSPGGRWTRIGPTPVDVPGTDLVDVALALLDDEELWSVPEEPER